MRNQESTMNFTNGKIFGFLGSSDFDIDSFINPREVQRSSKICTHFTNGHCRMGEKCYYTHPVQKIQIATGPLKSAKNKADNSRQFKKSKNLEMRKYEHLKEPDRGNIPSLKTLKKKNPNELLEKTQVNTEPRATLHKVINTPKNQIKKQSTIWSKLRRFKNSKLIKHNLLIFQKKLDLAETKRHKHSEVIYDLDLKRGKLSNPKTSRRRFRSQDIQGYQTARRAQRKNSKLSFPSIFKLDDPQRHSYLAELSNQTSLSRQRSRFSDRSGLEDQTESKRSVQLSETSSEYESSDKSDGSLSDFSDSIF